MHIWRCFAQLFLIIAVNCAGSDVLKKNLALCSRRLRLHAEQICQSGSSDKAQQKEQFPLGTVVWAKSKFYPPWPSLVVSKEDALAHGLKGE